MWILRSVFGAKYISALLSKKMVFMEVAVNSDFEKWILCYLKFTAEIEETTSQHMFQMLIYIFGCICLLICTIFSII